MSIEHPQEINCFELASKACNKYSVYATLIALTEYLNLELGALPSGFVPYRQVPR